MRRPEYNGRVSHPHTNQYVCPKCKIIRKKTTSARIPAKHNTTAEIDEDLNMKNGIHLMSQSQICHVVKHMKCT